MRRVNIGCGRTPTEGWENYDNSLSVQLCRIPVLPELLKSLRLLHRAQYEFIRFSRESEIGYADVTKGLPFADESCDVLYSSHMIEHLDRREVSIFLREARRVLRPGGIIRLVAPDITRLVERYRESGDADAFIEGTHLCAPRPRSLAHRMRILLVGTRHHQWMYDGNSLCLLLRQQGFVETAILPAGHTKIPDHQSLDLHERALESVYVEAEK